MESWFYSRSISFKSFQECSCKADRCPSQPSNPGGRPCGSWPWGSLGPEVNAGTAGQELRTSSVSSSQRGCSLCVFQITSAITARAWTTGAPSVSPSQGASASPGTPSTPTPIPSQPSASQSWTEGIPTAATLGTRRKLPGALPWMKTLSPTCVTSQHAVNSAPSPLLRSSPFPQALGESCERQGRFVVFVWPQPMFLG